MKLKNLIMGEGYHHMWTRGRRDWRKAKTNCFFFKWPGWNGNSALVGQKDCENNVVEAAQCTAVLPCRCPLWANWRSTSAGVVQNKNIFR
jgi:hypothetical protein